MPHCTWQAGPSQLQQVGASLCMSPCRIHLQTAELLSYWAEHCGAGVAAAPCLLIQVLNCGLCTEDIRVGASRHGTLLAAGWQTSCRTAGCSLTPAGTSTLATVILRSLYSSVTYHLAKLMLRHLGLCPGSMACSSWLQLLSCGPREHEKVAAALQDDRRQSAKMVKALEEELAAMQAAALVRDVPPGQQELPAQHASGLQVVRNAASCPTLASRRVQRGAAKGLSLK